MVFNGLIFRSLSYILDFFYKFYIVVFPIKLCYFYNVFFIKSSDISKLS